LKAKSILVGEDSSITSIDCGNAFNSLRSSIQEGIKRHCPSLLPLFYWSYGSPTDLLSGSGELICQSTRGVRQGDPLGPLLFCIGISTILEDAATRFPTITIMAYMDDIFLTGDKAESMSAFNFLQQSLPKVGLEVNQDKCAQFSSSTYIQIPSNLEGINILGSFIGKDQYVKRSVSDSLHQASNILGLITKLHAPEAFLLTRQCVNMRPFYLARVTPPSLFQEAAISFDSKISQTIESIAKVELSNVGESIRHLPCSLGGLGVSSIAIISPSAWDASFHRCMAVIKDRYPSLLDILDPPISEDSVANMKSQKELMEIKNLAIFNEIPNRISDPRTLALFLSNANPGTSKWMFSSLSPNPIDPTDYVEALRLRLLTPTFSFTRPRHGTPCPSCHQSDIGTDQFHALICRSCAYFTKWRHDRIRDCLINFIKAVNPVAIVTKEQVVSPMDSGRNLICDIQINESTHFSIIDVAVANPTCQSSLVAGSSKHQLAAARQKEKSKMYLYRRHLNKVALSNFIPFVLESTGSLGPAAKKFLDKLCGFGSMRNDPDFVKSQRIQLLRSISSILVRANAQLMRHGRSAGSALSLS
jgi:hypothetical protein